LSIASDIRDLAVAGIGEDNKELSYDCMELWLSALKTLPKTVFSSNSGGSVSDSASGPVSDPFLVALLPFLKKACNANAAIYAFFLPLLSLLPLEILSNTKYMDDFFAAFWKGVEIDTLKQEEVDALLKAYFECILYLVVKFSYDPITSFLQ